MSFTNASETALLNLLLRNQAWAGIGDASGLQPSAADGVFWLSLHTADPGEAPATQQTTNETGYTGYARVSVARNTGWSVSGDVGDNAAAITWPSVSAGSGTITHVGLGTDQTGNGTLVAKATVTGGYTLTVGKQPQILTGGLDWLAS